MTIKRLNWGCGHSPEPGWINADRRDIPEIDIVCDIRDGLPLDNGSIDYTVSIHALQEIPYPDVVCVLQELRRVLKPNGVLRLVLPDLDKSIRAYLRNDKDYFLISDEDSKSIGGKLIVQVLWYGHSRTLFTFHFIEELLFKAGFSEVSQCRYKVTKSAYEDIVALDRREQESLFIEAIK